MHPRLLAVLEHPECDDRLLNEVAGFLIRCAAQSGQHSTDYVVSRGTAIQVAGASRVETMVALCVATELMTEVEVEAESGRATTAYKIVDDDHDFIHLRLKKEIDWERQRKADAQKPSLIVPVRLRDGDACRWCGVVVNWSDHRSARGATYDHLDPGEAATIDTYVVSCLSCNSSRQRNELPQGVTALLDPPAQPYFSRSSVKWLTENQWRIDEGLPVPEPSATHINPGRRPDGSQPPGTRTKGSPKPVTVAAVGAAAGDQTSNAQDNGVQCASTDRVEDPQPVTVAAVSAAAGGSNSRDDDPDSVTVAAVGAAAEPDSSGDSDPVTVAAGSAAAESGSPPVDRRHDLPPSTPITPPMSPGGLITSPSPPAQIPTHPIVDGYRGDRMNRRGTGLVESGRVGSGRGGSGLPPRTDFSSDRPRGSRGSRSGRRRRLPEG